MTCTPYGHGNRKFPGRGDCLESIPTKQYIYSNLHMMPIILLLAPSLRVWPHVPWEDMSIVLKCKFPSKIHYQLSWGRSCSIHYPGNTWEVIKHLPCDEPCCMVGYVHPNSLNVSAAFCVSHKSTTYVILLIVCALICTSYHYTGSL